MARIETCGFLWVAKIKNDETQKTSHVRQECILDLGHKDDHKSPSGVTVINKNG